MLTIKHLLLLSGSLLVLAACNDQKKPAGETAADINDKTEMPSDALQEASQQKTEELQKMEPYTIDQMKALLPVAIAEWPQLSAAANAALGAPFAAGQYQLSDSVTFDVNVFDCAGPAGAGIYNRQFLAAMDFRPSSDEESAVIDFKGAKAIEHLDKVTHIASFSYMNGDRFLVTVEGKDVEKDILRKAAENINLK